MQRQGLLLAAAMAAGLAGCGKSGGGGGGGGVALGGPKWDVADACKTLDKSAVAAATGQQVKDTQTTPSGGPDLPAAVSLCSYNLTNGTLAVMTRVSKDDMTDSEIEQFRSAGGLMKPGVDEPGLGMKAFWMVDTRQLQVIADRKHYFSVTYGPALTLPGTPTPAGPDPHAVATTLAKKLL